MLNIIRNEKKIEKLAKKAEAEYAMALGQQVEAIASYAEGDTNFRKEKQFVNEVRKLSMDEADQIIINHMAKKMLSFIKLKIIKKKIRIYHYILKFILKVFIYLLLIYFKIVFFPLTSLKNATNFHQKEECKLIS